MTRPSYGARRQLPAVRALMNAACLLVCGWWWLTSAVSNGICLVARGGTCEGNRGVEAASALLVLTATYGQAGVTGGADP